MKKILLVSILALFISVSLNAQENNRTLIAGSNQTYTFDKSDKSVKGSPYINDSFSPARVKSDGIKVYKIRYNALADQMEVEDENSKKYTIDKSLKNVLITFISDNKTYQSYDYENKDGNLKRGFFVNVSPADNKVKLLNKEFKKYIAGAAPKNGYSAPKPAYYKKVDEYYIKINDNSAVVLPNKGKKIAALFPEKSSDIIAFIKANKIKTSKEAHLIKLMNHISTL
ncbi:hypothetical protein A9Q87_09360 [Flavobacteriales bacterium 34_180_T64]|nr:hypothetical protein A9Q87_09360 [Flavobacteriales bacterium 34_180_T64]